jgi:hypothetical protein
LEGKFLFQNKGNFFGLISIEFLSNNLQFLKGGLLKKKTVLKKLFQSNEICWKKITFNGALFEGTTSSRFDFGRTLV